MDLPVSEEVMEDPLSKAWGIVVWGSIEAASLWCKPVKNCNFWWWLFKEKRWVCESLILELNSEGSDEEELKRRWESDSSICERGLWAPFWPKNIVSS